VFSRNPNPMFLEYMKAPRKIINRSINQRERRVSIAKREKTSNCLRSI
jgi:hypothetical protein